MTPQKKHLVGAVLLYLSIPTAVAGLWLVVSGFEWTGMCLQELCICVALTGAVIKKSNCPLCLDKQCTLPVEQTKD